MPIAPLAVLGERQSDAAGSSEFLPHVVAWNLTKRCNLECAHCYIAAGPTQTATGELTTEECLRIADEILAVNPAPMFILSGGEPLLRDDLATIAAHATKRGATVVVGTNGTLLTDARIEELQNAGVTGVAVSIESLNTHYHDRFRRGHGSLEATLEAVERLRIHRLDFVVQTTLTSGNRAELAALVAWAADQGAVSFNAYFLVATGRGANVSGLTTDQKEDALTELVDLHERFLGRMMVRAKCAPQFMRLVHERVPHSPVLNYGTRCPCGVHYCRITPDGRLTACPYLPVVAGDLRAEPFRRVWESANLFQQLRDPRLGGKCGRCAYRRLCGGCRANAFASDGDYLAADQSCGYQPDGQEAAIAPGRQVTYGASVSCELSWSPEARERLERVPSFVRAVVVKRIEDFARREGVLEVTAELMRDVRRTLPIDFSKRMPFFLRDD